MNNERLKRYALIAHMYGLNSKNKKLQVGCFIMRDERIISSGYNGKIPGQDEPETATEKQFTVHAEQNALMAAAKNGISTDGCDMIVTYKPCSECTKLAIMAGIRRIYYSFEYDSGENQFQDYIEMVKIDGISTSSKK